MSTNTINAPAPEQHYAPQQDPWGEVEASAPRDEDGRIQLSNAEYAQRYNEIISRYDEPAPEPVSPTPNSHAKQDYLPTRSPEEIARRDNAMLLANFALARTLGDSNPELMAELAAATHNIDTVPIPAVRPDNYTARHRNPKGYRGRHRR